MSGCSEELGPHLQESFQIENIIGSMNNEIVIKSDVFSPDEELNKVGTKSN